ncbi:MAG: hypothetical protein PHT49_06330 [Desulfovibrionales bacterium]|nr:hypothetical protein [Desulfovibrionales bacterium]
MKKYYKFKNWYRGKHIPYSMEEMFELQRPRYLEKGEPIPDRFKPPLIARILNPIGQFWIRHWKWIIGTVIFTILTTTGLYLAYLQYLLEKAGQK